MTRLYHPGPVVAREAGKILFAENPGLSLKIVGEFNLEDFIVARICDQLAVRQDLMRRWGDGEK